MNVGVGLGLLFSPVAGVMAFLITYHEYRHHYPDPGPARREALRTGLFATVVFFVLMAVAGLALEHTLGPSLS